jgi:hypothetical protein
LASGSTIQLIFLDGTIPMVFSGVKYNCPIQIWFCPEYPQNPPTCVVVPIPTMEIKPGHNHVGPDGRVYHHCLSQWNESSSLEFLLNTLSQVFGTSPPVYSTATRATNSVQPAVSTNKPTGASGSGQASLPGINDEDALRIALQASKDEEEKRRAKMQTDDQSALQKALEESELMERTRRFELIALVSSKLQVSGEPPYRR